MATSVVFVTLFIVSCIIICRNDKMRATIATYCCIKSCYVLQMYLVLAIVLSKY